MDTTTPTITTDPVMPRVAVIIFHKNVRAYPAEWIRQCVESIQKQTYRNFTVFEMDYGGSDNQIYPGGNFISKKLNTHADAHNFLLDHVFKTKHTNGSVDGDGVAIPFEFAFNVNVDDYYATDRFEKQMPWAQKGYDVISSNFYNIDETGRVMCQMQMHKKNFYHEANKGVNIIAHPVLCYSRKFWLSCSHLIPEQIPCDDFELWKREYERYKFLILPDYLLYYRSQKGAKPKSDDPQTDNPNQYEVNERNKIIDERREKYLRDTDGGRNV